MKTEQLKLGSVESARSYRLRLVVAVLLVLAGALAITYAVASHRIRVLIEKTVETPQETARQDAADPEDSDLDLDEAWPPEPDSGESWPPDPDSNDGTTAEGPDDAGPSLPSTSAPAKEKKLVVEFRSEPRVVSGVTIGEFERLSSGDIKQKTYDEGTGPPKACPT